MSEHTPGKLVVRGGYSIYAEGGTMPIADACVTASKITNDEANARRLVAAWNACDGISTERLESSEGLFSAVGDAFTRCNSERDSLRALNAELVAALDRIDGMACYASEENTDSKDEMLLNIGAHARAAIARATAPNQGEQQ